MPILRVWAAFITQKTPNGQCHCALREITYMYHMGTIPRQRRQICLLVNDLFQSRNCVQGQEEAGSKAAPPAATFEAILEREERSSSGPAGDIGGNMDLVAAALAGLPEEDEAHQLAALAAAGGGSLEARI